MTDDWKGEHLIRGAAPTTEERRRDDIRLSLPIGRKTRAETARRAQDQQRNTDTQEARP